jgi:DNA-binding beta-propeller fold protein YncE
LLAAIIFPDGNFVTSWGVKGIGEGDFLHPHGIAVDPQGFIYVTDEEKHGCSKV